MAHVTGLLHESGDQHERELSRAEAFRNAARHSSRVRLLKRMMVFGSLGAVLVIGAIAIFDPFGHVSSIFSVEGFSLHGSKVMMEKPRVAGVRQDGRPYQMTAQSMTQDLRKPTAFDLTGVDGTIGMADKSSTKITAKTGYYDNAANSMDLAGDVHVRNDAGFEAFLESAHIDFKSSGVVSDKPVKVLMNTTTITADSMTVSDSGRKVVFIGHIKSVLVPQKTAQDTVDDLKESTP